MMPIGPLMIEHRLIEKLIAKMKDNIEKFRRAQKIDIRFIDASVDFLQTYADRCHHGKEEDILFRDLKKKGISGELREIMEGLIADHVRGRQNVRDLIEAREKYARKENGAFDEILAIMTNLVRLYPPHIEKEDKHFFLPVMKLFSKEEQAAMLAEEKDFEAGLLHEKYEALIKSFSAV